MKKNKKILLVIITILLSTMLFTNKAKATYMYLDCEFIEKYKEDDIANIFTRLTDEKGTKFRVLAQLRLGLIDTKMKVLDDESFLPDKDGCWIPDVRQADDTCKSEWMKEGQIEEKLRNGTCPAGIRSTKLENNTRFVPIGEGKIKSATEILEDEYIFYSLENSRGNVLIYGEGYNQEGLYANINAITGDDAGRYQLQFITGIYDKNLYKNLLGKIGRYLFDDSVWNSVLGRGYRQPQLGSYWQVSTNREAIFPNYLCAIYGADSNTDCYSFLESRYGIKFKVIIDSKDSTHKLDETVRNWYSPEAKNFEETSGGYKKLKEKENLIEEAKKIRESIENKTTYSFPDDYRPKDMLEDLKEAYNNLKDIEEYKFTDYSMCYTGTNDKITPAASLYTYAWTNIFSLDGNSQVCDSDDLKRYYAVKFGFNEGIEERSLNSGELDTMVYNSLDRALKAVYPDSEDILNIDTMVKEYIRDFTIMISYIDSNYRELLSDTQKQELDAWREKYETYASENNIVVVIDCSGLLGQELIDKINSYLNIIKIAVPIILIGFGIIEFSKAVFAGQEDQMKKAQKNFIKRLAIAIIIFFVPTIINLILQLANKVWPIIESSSCKIG